VEITGACLNKEFLVTGMIVGILGKEVATGTFEVIDVCLPGIPDQSPLNSLQGKSTNKAFLHD
jgi:DNA polymerase delta subunit 2